MPPWILAARPKTLPAAIVPVWVGCVLAWKMEGRFDLILALATLIGAIAIQIATNFFNDALDADKGADTEKRLGPQRVTASGTMSRKAVYLWGSAFLLLAALCGIILLQARGPLMLAIGIPSLFLAYGYTGGPWPLAYKGLGELFVILFFGLIAVGGTVFVQLGHWPKEALILGLQIGLLSALLISINNLRDENEDRSTGKGTLAARFGRKLALATLRVEALLPLVITIIMAKHSEHWTHFHLIPCIIGPLLYWKIKSTAPSPAYNKFLALAALQLLLFALAFHLS